MSPKDVPGGKVDQMRAMREARYAARTAVAKPKPKPIPPIAGEPDEATPKPIKRARKKKT